MNRRLFKLAALALVTAAALPAHAETKLLFNVFVPPGHVLERVAQAWAADVQKATDGNVKIEFAAGNLAPPPQQMSATASGIFDIAMSANPFIKSKAPLLEVSSLPFLVSNAEAASVASWRIYEKYFADKRQLTDVQLLSVYNAGGGQVFSLNDTPINSIDELKSRKMWALPGEAADLLKNLGMSPITSPAVQVSESVSRGVVDGYYGLTIDGAEDFKAAPYTKAVTILPKAATSTGFAMFMNKGKWASIPKKDRDTIMALSGEALARRVGKAYDESGAAALAKMRANGVKVVDADPAFYAALQKSGEASYKQFEGIAAKAGLDGKAVVADYKTTYESLLKR